MNLYILLLIVLLNEGALALQLAASHRSIARSCLGFHALVLGSTVGALLLVHQGGLLHWVLAGTAITGFLYATVLQTLLMALLARQIEAVQFMAALRTLSWLRWFPMPVPIAKQRADIEEHDILRRGDPTDILTRRHQALQEALRARDSNAVHGTAMEIIHALVLSRRWGPAVDIHQNIFQGRFAMLPPVSVAMLARAYGTLGDLAQMTRALADLEHRRDRIADVGSLNFARVVYLSYQGAADEIDLLLGDSSGLLTGAPRFVRPFYRGIAHYRAGHVDRALELFTEATRVAPESERPVLEESVQTFLSLYQDRAPASLEPSEQEVVRALLDRIAPYTALPRTGLAIKGLPVTWSIVALNGLIWAWLALTGDTTDPGLLIDAGALYAPAVAAGEWWRLLAPIFLHAGVLHIVLNSLGLLYLGRLTERLYGSAAFLMVYAVAGVAGTVSSYLFGQVVSVGASGAIFGVLGALIALLMAGKARFPDAWRTRYLKLMLVLAGINIFFGLQIDQVDNAAHIGGLIGGFLMGTMLARRRGGQDRSKLSRTLLHVGLLGIIATGAMVAERVATTSREETIQRIPAQTVAVGLAEFAGVPGTWLQRRFDGVDSLVFDPFRSGVVEISLAHAVATADPGSRQLAQAAAKAARALSQPGTSPVFEAQETVPRLLWRFSIRRHGVEFGLLYIPVATPDGSGFEPVLLIYEPGGGDEEMVKLLLSAMR